MAQIYLRPTQLHIQSGHAVSGQKPPGHKALNKNLLAKPPGQKCTIAIIRIKFQVHFRNITYPHIPIK